MRFSKTRYEPRCPWCGAPFITSQAGEDRWVRCLGCVGEFRVRHRIKLSRKKRQVAKRHLLNISLVPLLLLVYLTAWTAKLCGALTLAYAQQIMLQKHATVRGWRNSLSG